MKIKQILKKMFRMNLRRMKYFEQMIKAAADGREPAALCRQAGSYRCSTPDIDLIVDSVNNVRGVKGAQLSGAGLGGCAIALVEESAVDKAISVLTEKYYSTRELEPAIAVCTPVAGSGVLAY